MKRQLEEEVSIPYCKRRCFNDDTISNEARRHLLECSQTPKNFKRTEKTMIDNTCSESLQKALVVRNQSIPKPLPLEIPPQLSQLLERYSLEEIRSLLNNTSHKQKAFLRSQISKIPEYRHILQNLINWEIDKEENKSKESMESAASGITSTYRNDGYTDDAYYIRSYPNAYIASNEWDNNFTDDNNQEYIRSFNREDSIPKIEELDEDLDVSTDFMIDDRRMNSYIPQGYKTTAHHNNNHFDGFISGKQYTPSYYWPDNGHLNKLTTEYSRSRTYERDIDDDDCMVIC
ncbi:unnamed protein product [Ambrosiozyma monospora]|uniref:Unnamed protein product n=1 Tax=Ambrosiozyma monospora TaxID=43982 RepID=A0A9W7DG66_AMBMO|nr:unnamed protein product [Ambrosiozyma monospora]